MPALYGLASLPRLLGVPGGILLSIGSLALALLKLKSDRQLAMPCARGEEFGFMLLLFLVGASGLSLCGLGSTVLLAALVREQQVQRLRNEDAWLKMVREAKQMRT